MLVNESLQILRELGNSSGEQILEYLQQHVQNYRPFVVDDSDQKVQSAETQLVETTSR